MFIVDINKKYPFEGILVLYINALRDAQNSSKEQFYQSLSNSYKDGPSRSTLLRLFTKSGLALIGDIIKYDLAEKLSRCLSIPESTLEAFLALETSRNYGIFTTKMLEIHLANLFGGKHSCVVLGGLTLDIALSDLVYRAAHYPDSYEFYVSLPSVSGILKDDRVNWRQCLLRNKVKALEKFLVALELLEIKAHLRDRLPTTLILNQGVEVQVTQGLNFLGQIYMTETLCFSYRFPLEKIEFEEMPLITPCLGKLLHDFVQSPSKDVEVIHLHTTEGKQRLQELKTETKMHISTQSY